MKKTLCLCFALFAMLTSFAAKTPFSFEKKKTETTEATADKTPVDVSNDASTASLSKLTLKDLQKTLGRKLTLEEKISWLLFKKRLVHIEPSDKEKQRANSNAIWGFVLGILGLVGFYFLAAIPGLILSSQALNAEKTDPGILNGGNRGLAKAGQIMSWIGIALTVLVVIYIAALLGSIR